MVESVRRAPFIARDRSFPLGAKTYVIGILNLTGDSFSGDGVGSDLDAAVRAAVAIQTDGGDIVDVGAESARADVPVRAPEEEASVIGEAIHRIAQEIDIAISADTYKGPVADASMQAGAHIINDIGGFMNDTSTAEVAAKFGAGLVINYTLERPKVRPSAPPVYDDLISAHLRFFQDRVATARRLGVHETSLIIDPGIAFGKSHDEDLQVLRHLEDFLPLGLPVLVAASRKHFIGSVLELPPLERDEATVVVTAVSIANGADFVRVHNVRANVRAARMTDALVRGRPGDFAASATSWPWAAGVQPAPGTSIQKKMGA